MKTTDPEKWVEIDTAEQRLVLHCGDTLAMDVRVSTATNGLGELLDSECTPRGVHEIAEKIGDGAPLNTIFVGRRPTGELYSKEMRRAEPGRDWILTRILWLDGAEPGKNKGGRVDTRARYIYIHGAPDDVRMGEPGSRGCIRMRNSDVVALFDAVERGTRVIIK